MKGVSYDEGNKDLCCGKLNFLQLLLEEFFSILNTFRIIVD